MQVPELEASETWYARFYTLAGGELAKVTCARVAPACVRRLCRPAVDCQLLLDPCCNTAFLISLYSREINLNPNPPVPVPVRFRHGAHIPGRPDRAEEALAQMPT